MYFDFFSERTIINNDNGNTIDKTGLILFLTDENFFLKNTFAWFQNVLKKKTLASTQNVDKLIRVCLLL